jgi:membrane fusion protein (multidrug efflux system)
MLDNGTANPGAFVKVYVGSNNPKKAIMVPTNVIIPGDKENQVILVKKGKASFVNVNTGTRTEGSVEITEGIKPGDTVVVTGVLFARPNMPVRVRGVKKLEQLQ